MRASTVTKLPLARWFQIVGVHPLHAAGVYVDIPSVCQQPWPQYSWMSADRVSREDVARAIAEAEANIERAVGYRLLPTWEVDEWQEGDRPYRPEFVNKSVTDIRGFRPVNKTDWGHLITGGVRAKELIEAASPIVYTDEDGDVYDETATVTVTTTAPACEIRVYFPGLNGDDAWEVRPIAVSKAGNVATIVFRRELVVDPDLWEVLNWADTGIVGTVDGNFLTTVDVYRVYNDPQTQVTYLWEPLSGTCGCGAVDCPECSYATSTGCIMVRGDPRLGIISYHPATWDAATDSFLMAAWGKERSPEILRLYYYAGLRDKKLTCPAVQMSREWEQVVAYYAAALLDRPICECNNVGAWIDHWRLDLARVTDAYSANLPQSVLNNPFGTTRGAINAWRKVNGEGVALGRAVVAL